MILVAGRINVDTVIELESRIVCGGKTIAKSIHIFFGGSGLNAATAAKRFCGDRNSVALVGCLGNDEYRDRILELIRREGIDLRYIDIVEGSCGRAYILLEPEGRVTIATYPGVNALCNLVRELEDFDIAIVTNPTPSIAEKILSKACDLSAPVVMDFGTEWLRLKPVALKYSRRLDYCIVIPSDYEIDTSIGLEAAARRVAEELGCNVVVKRGAQGSYVYELNGDEYHVPPLPLRDLGLSVVSTAGCGDTFTGVLGAALVEGYRLRQAVVLATIAAGIKASRMDPRDAPRRREIMQIYTRLTKYFSGVESR